MFNKLYGIEYASKQIEIDACLKTLKIGDKLQIENGVFSSIKLSSGQRKRIAFLISYLEDKPIFVFDEWAAEQDPEFREYFYLVLLPQLKRNGKCVIAITHDDRYFSVADRLVKMEMGTVINS